MFILRRYQGKNGKEVNQIAECTCTACGGYRGVQSYCLTSLFFGERTRVFSLLVIFYYWYVNLNDVSFMIDKASM